MLVHLLAMLSGQLKLLLGILGMKSVRIYDPYANIAQRGVLCAQLNSILAMMPNLNLGDKDSLPCGAKQLKQGYALLRHVKILQDESQKPRQV
jgi:hypothetical protein